MLQLQNILLLAAPSAIKCVHWLATDRPLIIHSLAVPHCLPLHLLLILMAAATPAAGVARIVTCPSVVWPGDAVHSAARDQIVPPVSWHQTRTNKPRSVYFSCEFNTRSYDSYYYYYFYSRVYDSKVGYISVSHPTLHYLDKGYIRFYVVKE